MELLDLLRDAGGDLDDLEITDLNTKMLEPWDGVEAPVTMFARADKYERQLECHSIPKQAELRLSYAVSTYQTSGQFDAAMREWHAKLSADKTFSNFRVYIQTEYTKMVKWNRSTAGSVGKGIVNEVTENKLSDAEAQAMVIAEVANVLQAQNAEQMKNMMAMFEKLLTAQAPIVPVVDNPPKTPKRPRQPRAECPHCSKKHVNHDKCWELDSNKALRPANWKSTKTVALRCPEDEPTKQWQPGKIEIHKITKGFSYLVAKAGPISPPTPPDPIKSALSKPHARLIVESDKGPRPPSKWARRLAKWKAIKDNRRAENQVIDEAIHEVRVIQEAMLDSGATSNFIKSANGFKLTGPSSKSVSTANGQIMKATNTALLPLTQLTAGAREAIVIPEMSTNALMSVKQLADQGYTTIFHPYLQGATVHDNDSFELVINKPPLLQGWRDNGGLWTVPLAE